jgi:thiosulfate/3-mercaptopyruvate sulfurtransferase
MLRLFGAPKVSILEGGLPKWKAEGRALETGPVVREPRTFKAHFEPSGVANAEAVKRAMETGSHQIVDARNAPRFRGETEEPRAGLRSGHIPGSFNLPWRELVIDGKMKPPAEIKEAFEKAGVDLARPVITSCGSGVTAAILLLGLATIGKADVVLYDGSWTEWGGRYDLPVVKG